MTGALLPPDVLQTLAEQLWTAPLAGDVYLDDLGKATTRAAIFGVSALPSPGSVSRLGQLAAGTIQAMGLALTSPHCAPSAASAARRRWRSCSTRPTASGTRRRRRSSSIPCARLPPSAGSTVRPCSRPYGTEPRPKRPLPPLQTVNVIR